MTVEQIAQKLDLRIVCGGDSLQREVNGRLYCCDLLSIVMGRAPADGVWVTVMAIAPLDTSRSSLTFLAETAVLPVSRVSHWGCFSR